MAAGRPSAACWLASLAADCGTRPIGATGWTHCYPLWNDTTYPVTLKLLPGAAGIKGTLKLGGSEIPVSGSATGTRLRLSGTGDHPSSGVTVTYVVEAQGLVVDRVGRLTGDVTLVSTYNWHDGRGSWTVRYPPLPLHAAAHRGLETQAALRRPCRRPRPAAREAGQQ